MLCYTACFTRYYGLSIVLTSFLTDDFGATDLKAGSIYGLLGMLISMQVVKKKPLAYRVVECCVVCQIS